MNAHSQRWTRLRLAWLVWILIPGYLLYCQPVAYQPTPPPKREMRAVWIATVLNIDYPRTPSTNPVALKEQYRNLLDQMADLGFNTVIFQVRPTGDAFYPSRFAPWSAYLTGQQGTAPTDSFDPLAFMIEETHARAMEFHAWVNPFRVSMKLDSAALSPQHVRFQHPDWVVAYGGKWYLDPGQPLVRQYLVDVVGELVDEYDLDGIHIDDYFYPYPTAGEVFPDSITYSFYGFGAASIEDWRRANTDELVQQLNQRIKAARPNVVFGVSPFGVWRNADRDPQRGSRTRASVSSYDDLYADVLKWADRGWIDYVMPQLYWNIGFAPADHLELLQWWSRQVHNAQLFTGLAAYKVGNNAEPAWHDPMEIPRQVDLNRRNFQSQGSSFFSARSVLNDPLHLKDTLRSLYRTWALLPERPNLEVDPVRHPEMKRPRFRRGAVSIRWRPHESDRDRGNLPAYYAIYRFDGQGVGDLNDPKHILALTPLLQNCDKYEFLDFDTESDATYTYVVTAFNRAHSESSPSEPRIIWRKDAGVRQARLE
ncbi:MAG: family 10 glycosylhydrolase [Lewinella sp.]|nr:family 10 glycosylhydrolase [Lewinella sp.]